MRSIEERRVRVKRHYGEFAQSASRGSTCCDSDYSEAELSVVPKESILGQGSGNPVRHADTQPGEVVVDLGSGAEEDRPWVRSGQRVDASAITLRAFKPDREVEA